MTDSRIVRGVATLFDVFFPGRYRSMPLDALDQALDFVGANEEERADIPRRLERAIGLVSGEPATGLDTM